MIELPVKLSVVLLNIETPLHVLSLTLPNYRIASSITPSQTQTHAENSRCTVVVCHSPSHVDMT